MRRDRYSTIEIPVTVDCAQLRRLVGPFCNDPAAAHDLFRFDFEQIRKVAASRNLQIEAHAPQAMIHEVKILVKAAIN